MAWAWYAHWSLGLILAFLFVRYEENEDAHTKDQAWKDYYGAIAGAVMGALTIIGLRLFGKI